MHAHWKSVVHLDLMPEDFLLEGGHLKIRDFGVSKLLSGEEMPEISAYMSPEAISGKERLSEKADIWALGCILYELLTHRCPFDPNSQNLAHEIMNAKQGPIPAGFSKQLDMVIGWCLSKQKG